MIGDNLVRRKLRDGGATYSLEADEGLDGKLNEAAEVLKSSPEAVIATALSSFLSSYQSCLEQAMAKAKPEVKH